MTGILPNNGVPPGNTQNGVEDPLLADGCDNLYYGPRCNPRLDPFQANAVISELLNALKAIGIAYDCSRLDNLATAFLQMDAAPVAQPSGAPSAILQQRYPSGTNGGSLPAASAWFTRELTAETYDPGGIVSLAGNQFTVITNAWVEWDARFYDAGACKSRLYNVTDGVTVDVGSSEWDLDTSDAESTVTTEGGGFLQAGKTYRLECWASRASNNTAARQGRATGAGVDELYATVRLWRMA